MAPTLLVTGAAGQLGGAILREFAADHRCVALTRTDLDITDHGAVLARVRAERPDAIVNCASYNDVDAAEGEPVRTLEINAFAVQSLARAAAEIGAVLVHYSTDFVFDGKADRPYTEDDTPNPRSVYAGSKLVGEWLAAGTPRHVVLRVESLFGAAPGWQGRRSSVDKIIEGLEAGEPVRVFTDRTVSPSYVVDIAASTRRLLEGRAPAGLYHCVNAGACTWEELATEAARLLGCVPRLDPVSFGTVRLRAPRPKYCALSPARLATLGIVMPPWQDALARHIRARGQANG